MTDEPRKSRWERVPAKKSGWVLEKVVPIEENDRLNRGVRRHVCDHLLEEVINNMGFDGKNEFRAAFGKFWKCFKEHPLEWHEFEEYKWRDPRGNILNKADQNPPDFNLYSGAVKKDDEGGHVHTID